MWMEDSPVPSCGIWELAGWPLMVFGEASFSASIVRRTAHALYVETAGYQSGMVVMREGRKTSGKAEI